MSLISYLKVSYDFVTNKISEFNLVPVVICCCHFVHIIAMKVNKNFSKKKVLKNLIIDVMCVILDAETISAIDDIFKLLCIILTSDKKTKNVDDSYSSLINLLKGETGKKCIEFSEEYDGADDVGNPCIDTKSKEIELNFDKNLKRTYMCSPFFDHFNKILNYTLESMENDTINDFYDDNEMYDKFLLEYLLKFYFSYLPLFSTVILKRNGCFERPSNAPVEGWFKIVKHNFLNGEKKLKVGRFVDIMQEKTSQILKEVALHNVLDSKSKSTTSKKIAQIPTSKASNFLKEKSKEFGKEVNIISIQPTKDKKKILHQNLRICCMQ